MTKADESIKCRNMMYVQQVKHLPNNMCAAEMINIVANKLHPKKWAAIVHDKDKKADEKTPAEPQLHIMMQFENARSIDQIAKELGDEPQYVQKWDSRPINGFAYLIHATSGSRHLHQYSTDEVTANFDFVAEIKKAADKYSGSKASHNNSKIENLLNMIAKGDITLRHAKDLLSGAEYAKAAKKLDAAHSLYLERCSNSLYEQMMENNQIIAVNWFYGETETGKTFLAEKLAKDLGEYYKTTTTKDPFQFYQAEPVVILDELRPTSLEYSEILAMFDPFSGGKVKVSSRYYNKSLCCHTFFVTSPYSPEEFYENIGDSINRTIDRPEQFYRRITSVLRMTLDVIEKMEYDGKCFLKTDEKPNKYSNKNHTIIPVSHIFDNIE